MQKLDDVQKKAVKDNGGPMIIEAAAGSGKTRVITSKVAALVRDSISPGNILCVTFTKNAAEEMRERLNYLLGESISGQIWIETFHGLCLRIMSEYGEKLGYKKGFTVYDESDSIDIVSEVLKDLNVKRSAVKEVARIQKARMEDQKDPVMVEYLSRMKRANAVDFTGLIINATKLIDSFESIRKIYEFKFRYIMIDEYQDINDHQYNLISKLWKKWRNVTVVGDPRQTIFSFQGANISHINGFMREFPESCSVSLATNYRSSSQIVGAANSLIRNNNGGFKDMLSDRGAGWNDVVHTQLDDDEEEARWIVEKIKHIVDTNPRIDYGDIAILYRMHRLRPLISEALERAGVANVIVGSSTHFFKMEEILRYLDYLKLAVNHSDSLAFRRVMNIPNRNIGFVDFLKMESQANGFDISLLDSAARSLGKMKMDYSWINTVKESVSRGLLASSKIVMDILVEYYEDKKLETKAENCRQAHQIIQDWSVRNGDSIKGFIDEVAEFKVSKEDIVVPEKNAVKLMTIHASKGLEFPVVFIPGLEKGIFPISRNEEDILEERRLLYVGITRAEDMLFLSSVKERAYHGKKSKQIDSLFLEELGIYERKN